MKMMTTEERRARREAKKAEAAAWAKRKAEIHALAVAEVASGKCPQCGAGIHRNSSLAGWWQCDRSGSGHFRRDLTGNHCTWQTFTE
jgi:hypothetical protein